MVYTLHDTNKQHTLDLESGKRFKIGHAVHDMLQKSFHAIAKKTGQFTFQDEVSVRNTKLAEELCIESSCDGMFTFANGRKILLEIKTESPDGYEKLRSPRAKHIEQIHVYMACLQVHECWMLYWNKGNQRYTPMLEPWLVKFDEKVWNKIRARIEDCLRHAESGDLPPREEGFHCNWCAYAHTCEPKETCNQSRRSDTSLHMRRLRND